MDKENVVSAYNGLLLSHRKEGNPAICDNMEEPLGQYAKWNKSEEKKYGMISPIYGI